MNSNKTRLGQFILIFAASLSLTSCMLWDADPYSSTRNEYYSLIGFNWEGVTYTQEMHQYFLSRSSKVSWGIVDIENEKYILIVSSLDGGGLVYESGGRPVVQKIYVIIPFQNVEIGKTYSAKVYPSIVYLMSSKKIFNFDGEESARYLVPITINASFSKISSKSIQGTFTADDGIIDWAEGTQQDFVLRDGTFNLSYESGYASGSDRGDQYLESWLQNIDYLKLSIQDDNRRYN